MLVQIACFSRKRSSTFYHHVDTCITHTVRISRPVWISAEKCVHWIVCPRFNKRWPQCLFDWPVEFVWQILLIRFKPGHTDSMWILNWRIFKVKLIWFIYGRLVVPSQKHKSPLHTRQLLVMFASSSCGSMAVLLFPDSSQSDLISSIWFAGFQLKFSETEKRPHRHFWSNQASFWV